MHFSAFSPFSLRLSGKTLLFATLALGLCAGPLAAAEQQAPINIEANRMVSQENSNSVVFLGKVVAKQGGMTIRTDEMTVYYDDAAGGDKAAGQLDRLVCVKNVKITQDDWLGTGNRLDYYAKNKKAVLSGDAKAWNGPNMIAGSTITYYLDEKRSVVSGPKTDATNPGGRVKAVIKSGAGK